MNWWTLAGLALDVIGVLIVGLVLPRYVRQPYGGVGPPDHAGPGRRLMPLGLGVDSRRVRAASCRRDLSADLITGIRKGGKLCVSGAETPKSATRVRPCLVPFRRGFQGVG